VGRGDVYRGARLGGHEFSGRSDFIGTIQTFVRNWTEVLNERDKDLMTSPWLDCLVAIDYARTVGELYRIDGVDILGEGKAAEIIATLAPVLHLAKTKYKATTGVPGPKPDDFDPKDITLFRSCKPYRQMAIALVKRLLLEIQSENPSAPSAE
jgi:hypothetical protein